MPDFETCTCPEDGYATDCPMARGGIGHVKSCPDFGYPCPCLPGSLSEAYCYTKSREDESCLT